MQLSLKRSLTAVAMLITGALPLCVFAADDDAARVRSTVDSVIPQLMSREDIAGMAVAVTMNGHAYVFNYGTRSKETGAPVDDHTLFEIGSVSKTLTATLASYALVSGRLSLDDHPGRFVPALRGRPIDRASLLHFGTYTAGGLPLQFPDAVGASDDDAVRYLASWKPRAKPGVEREYSNVSLGLFGDVAGAALGNGFAKSMETQILPGLGMSESYLHVPPAAASDYAWGYRAGQPVRVHPGPFDLETYGIKTTALDLIRFVQDNIDPKPLEPTMRSAVEATHVGYFRVADMTQGLGWEQYAWPTSEEQLLRGNSDDMIGRPNPVVALTPAASNGARLFNKTGSTGGFGTYVVFVPSLRLGIVLLANKNYPIPARVDAAYKILHELVSDQNK